MHARAVLRVLLAVLTVSACAAPTEPSPASPAAPSGPPPGGGASAAPPVASGAPSTGALPSGPGGSGPPAVALELVAEGLVDPISVAGTPEGWLLVNERAGRVIAIRPADGRSAVAVDLGDRVLGGGEQGLLGLALHPGWPEVPRAFVHYSDLARGGDTVVSELAGTPGDAATAPTLDAASERVLLRVEQPFPNHNGGQLAFGPDGNLYVGLGDGGAGGDPLGHGQDTSTLLGSILRLDVSTPGAYSIPQDNPFTAGGGAAEVFLYGLRNPWRFSFDTGTGLLWIADVGQDALEEIDRIDPAAEAGANLGWNVMEGTRCFADAACSAEGMTLPVAEYGQDRGCSVTGGYVYRGGAIPDLRGLYLFGDYCSGRIFAVASDAEPPGIGAAATTPATVLESGLNISSFGQASDGELYVADLGGGALYRLVAAP